MGAARVGRHRLAQHREQRGGCRLRSSDGNLEASPEQPFEALPFALQEVAATLERSHSLAAILLKVEGGGHRRSSTRYSSRYSSPQNGQQGCVSETTVLTGVVVCPGLGSS